MIRLVTDSVASLPADVAKKRNIEVVTLFIHEGDTEHVDATMDLDAFYSRLPEMVAGEIPTSSQPSQKTFEDIFEEAAVAGDQVLGVFISTGLSGTLNGAVRAARAVKARHLDFKAMMVDTYSTGGDEMFPVLAAADAIDAGATLEEAAKAAAHAVERTRFLFAPETLTFLKKGGRIGKAAALLGNLVKIVPVLTVLDGVPKDIAKTRTQKKAMPWMFDKFVEEVGAHGGLHDMVVHYIGTPEVAQKWEREVVRPFVGHEVPVIPVSPVVGLHVGPAVGLAYICNEPLEGKITIDPEELITVV